MEKQKDSFSTIVLAFLSENGRPGRQLLEAMGDLLDPMAGPNPMQVELDRLVKTAATRAALRDPNSPLDQNQARKIYVALFRQLESVRVGKLIVGRRGRPTRFRFSSSAEAESGSRALRNVLRESNIETPSWIEEKEFDLPHSQPGSTHISAPVPIDRLRRADVVAQLKANSAKIHKLGVSALSLFGSVARDEARPDSDVDLVATFHSGVTSDGFFGAKFFLEDLLGRRVDLVTEAALRESVRRTVEPELIRVA